MRIFLFFTGIVQLEIRRARAGDAGVYTVMASNEMGDANVLGRSFCERNKK